MMLQDPRYRSGLLQLAGCLLVGFLWYGYYKVYCTPATVVLDFYWDEEATCFIENQQELLREKALEKRNAYKYPVNYLTAAKAYELGMTQTELTHFFHFKETHPYQKIYTLTDLQKVIQAPKQRMAFFAGRIRYAKPKTKFKPKSILPKVNVKHSSVLGNHSLVAESLKKDINTVTAKSLILDCKFPEFLAVRVVKYRKLIGGYQDMSQLVKVYGISKGQLSLLNARYKVSFKK